jgi:hypothetical protein
MGEVGITQAGEIVGVNRSTVFYWVDHDQLPARRQGIGRTIRIQIDDLRKFADQYNYRFNEQLAAQFTGQPQG